MDPKIWPWIIVGVVVVAIAAAILLKDRITKFNFFINKKGAGTTVEAERPYSPPAQGVDMSGSKLGNNNEVLADNEAKLKAPNMTAGSGNRIVVAKEINPSEKDKPKV